MIPRDSADSLNRLTSQIIASAIQVHRGYGSGLLESAYLKCLCYELQSANLHIETQRALPLIYRGVVIDCAYRADLVVENVVLVEVKAVDELAPIHTRQLTTYVKLADCRVGLLLNFGAPTMRDGIRRVVNRFPGDEARAR